MSGRIASLKFLAFALFFASTFLPLSVQAFDGMIYRDYATTEVPARGQVEVSADYLMMNDSIDVFDFREKEISSGSAAYRDILGDLKGGRILLNWGVLPKTNLHAEYARIELEVGPNDISIDTLELSVRRQVVAGKRSSWPSVAIDVGGRFNRAGDEAIRNVDHLDAYVKRINPAYSVDESASHYIISDGTLTEFVSKSGREPLEVATEEMQDVTPFVRLTVGKKLSFLSPYVFAEYGRSEIDSRIDSNINEFVPTGLGSKVENFPIDLDRSENYWKAGFDLFMNASFGLMGNLKYEYIRLDRDSGLDYVDYNHVVRADLTYPLNDRVAVNLGGTYFRRQLNGVIPFMYNAFTQTTFDHDYGYVHMGLMARF